MIFQKILRLEPEMEAVLATHFCSLFKRMCSSLSSRSSWTLVTMGRTTALTYISQFLLSQKMRENWDSSL